MNKFLFLLAIVMIVFGSFVFGTWEKSEAQHSAHRIQNEITRRPPKAAFPSPTAVIGSLPVTQMPEPVVIPLKVTDPTSLPCTHYATNKGRASWPGTQARPWNLDALRGSKKAAIRKWQAANHRTAKICGSQDFLPSR